MRLQNIVFLIVEERQTHALPIYAPLAELEQFASVMAQPRPGELPALLCGDFTCAPYGFRWRVFPLVFDRPTQPVGEIHYSCEGFTDWLESLPPGLPRLQATTGTGRLALMCFERFQSWAKPERARQAIEMIDAGYATFEQLREDVPDVFEVPAFKNYLAARMASGNMPKAKRGKRRNAEQHAAKRELYLLACQIEREEQPITWLGACATACERRPELVPATWVECPAENLRREGDGYYNKTRWGAYRLRNAPSLMADERPDGYYVNYLL